MFCKNQRRFLVSYFGGTLNASDLNVYIRRPETTPASNKRRRRRRLQHQMKERRGDIRDEQSSSQIKIRKIKQLFVLKETG